MHFLLLHSPLVTPLTWAALTQHLRTQGSTSSTVAMDHDAAPEMPLYAHHLNQIQAVTNTLETAQVIVVAHSGAGSLAALLNPADFAGFIFIDAIFPLAANSRFTLFDEPDAVRSWRKLAEQHSGHIPRTWLAALAEQIDDPRLRSNFIAELTDAPIALYEETIPIHAQWPPANGLYVQWTQSYAGDAGRAAASGFAVRKEPTTHFNMLNQPQAVAGTLLDFARDQEPRT
ncbi:MAG: alpha/beta fold hydrolase [Pseudomonadota bacterium]